MNYINARKIENLKRPTWINSSYRLVAWQSQGELVTWIKARNLASALSQQGKKILVIDLDPQGNATTGLGLSNSEQSDRTIYGILNGTT